jgi:hypothetical protein
VRIGRKKYTNVTDNALNRINSAIMTVAMDIGTTAREKHEIYTDIECKATSMRDSLGIHDHATSERSHEGSTQL